MAERSKGFLKNLADKSYTVNLFRRIGGAMGNAVRASAAYRLFTSYDSLEAMRETSLARSRRKAWKLSEKISRPAKRLVSKSADESLVIRAVQNAFLRLLDVSTRFYGVLFVTFGVTSALAVLIKYYFLRGDFALRELFFSLALAFVSLPLLFSKKRAADTLKENAVTSRLIFGFFGVRSVTYDRKGEALKRGTAAVLAGIGGGALSYWVKPYYIALFVFALFLAYTVICIPENGVTLIFLLVPFVPGVFLRGVVIFVCAAFLLKYVRGKRTLRFDALSVGVVCILLIQLLSVALLGRDGVPSGEMTRTVYTLAFFLVINLIKSREWFERCLLSFVFSAFAASVAVALGELRAVFPDSFFSLCVDIVSPFIPERSLMTGYFVFALPFMMARLISVRGAGRKLPAATVVILALAFCGYFAGSGMLMTYILSLGSFAVLGGKKSFAPFCAVLAGAVGAAVFLPAEWTSVFFRRSERALSRLAGIGSDTLRAFFTGAGSPSGNGVRSSGVVGDLGYVGPLIFTTVMVLALIKYLTLFSKNEGKINVLYPAAALSGAFAALIRWLASGSYDSGQTYLCFFLVLALCSASVEIENAASRVDPLLPAGWEDEL